jgi:hypothetical protein
LHPIDTGVADKCWNQRTTGKQAERRIEHAGRDRHAEGVAGEGEEEVLPDVPQKEPG